VAPVSPIALVAPVDPTPAGPVGPVADTVKYVSEVGPMRGQVVGSASRNGLRGWRIDFDATKGYHVNWWDKTGGLRRSAWFYGANIIAGGTLGDFLLFLEHLQ
jgi:hypothetical protein